ncbi:hypothetical protein HMPREF1448_00774 [Helicobacter pylori HP260AFi]|nr:hypothetical protein HMPREF1448_00774 [Helicobacter pylori HP260AFi]
MLCVIDKIIILKFLYTYSPVKKFLFFFLVVNDPSSVVFVKIP